MPPVRITLTEGVVGGFAPANPRRVIEINGDEDKAHVRVSKLVGKHDYEAQEGHISGADLKNLLNELRALRSLPTEELPTTQDIYGLDTAISVESSEFRWRNGGPEGCTHGESTVSANSEHKSTFKKVVDRLVATGENHAVKSI